MAREKKKRRSLIFSILRVSVIPIIILGIILTVYSQNSVREGMSFEVEKSLSGTAHNLISMYNMIDAGEFTYNNGKFMKGETDLTADYRVLDDIKNDTGADATIYFGTKRRLTTLVDKSGNRLVDTDAPDSVVASVIDKGEEYFSKSVSINGKEYFGYYVPIRNDSNEVVGVSFAGKAVSSINLSMKYMIEGNIIICIFVILLAGFACNWSASRMVEVIQNIMHFLSKVAHGDFSHKMPEMVLKRRDELAEMGEYAVTVSNSLEDMITTDPLTGLLNRRACQIQVENRKDQLEFTLAMADIDFFKQVNDSYGHKKGDEILRFVANTLLREVNDCGFVSRWGGEEFLIGFDGGAKELNARMQKALTCIAEEIFYCDGISFHVTMTFGITSYNLGEDFDTAVKRADDLLYYGKEHGRNQIVID